VDETDLIANGPTGLAIYDEENSNLIEFLSYGGQITSRNGFAQTRESTDIIMSQGGTGRLV